MSMTKEQLLNEALRIDPKQRGELAEQLRQSLVEGEFSSADIAEFRRRIWRLIEEK